MVCRMVCRLSVVGFQLFRRFRNHVSSLSIYSQACKRFSSHFFPLIFTGHHFPLFSGCHSSLCPLQVRYYSIIVVCCFDSYSPYSLLFNFHRSQKHWSTDIFRSTLEIFWNCFQSFLGDSVPGMENIFTILY